MANNKTVSYHDGNPAVSIKVYHLGWTTEDIINNYLVDEVQALAITDKICDSLVANFWTEARLLAARLLPDGTRIEPAGRSGGWIEIIGLETGDDGELTDEALTAYTEFYTDIKDELKYYAGWDAARAHIDAFNLAREVKDGV